MSTETGFRGLFAVLFVVGACSPSGPGRLSGPEAHVAAVGQPSNIELVLDSAAGQVLYDYEYSKDISGSTQINVRSDGSAVVILRPSGKDIGEVELTVGAKDAAGYSRHTILLEIRSTVGSATLPKFRRPMGEGTSLATAVDDCVELEILVDDQDTAEVEISQEAPLIEGGTIQLEGQGAAIWRWCPTEKQRAERDRYLLTLGADDGENPRILKRYLIIFDPPGKLGCPGAIPIIEHRAEAVETLDSILVSARVSDAEGLKGSPLVRYADDKQTKGGAVQLSMELESGDGRAGVWIARIPNPALGKAGGEKVPLAYEIVASDNDGRGSDCDHQATEMFSIEVTRPLEGPALEYCAPCENDAQCGGDKDLCLTSGVLGENICSRACDSDADCGSGSLCSVDPLTSVNGNVSRQCVPENDVCVADDCGDTRFEPNDTRAEAAPLSPGLALDLKICPVGHLASEEDWYQLELATDSQVDFGISADTYPNLDVRIFDNSGALVAASEDWGSDDSISRCLPAGTYQARVYSSFAGESSYQLDFEPSPTACEVTDCVADPYEDDDNAATARLPDFEGFVYRVSGNSICSGDQDWFEAYLFGDETIYATLTFDQTLASEDLDILVYDEAGALLTPCTPEDPSGCSQNGQSGTSNETFQFTAASAGRHYVVVNGFDGSANTYDICLALQPGLCP